MLLFNFNLVDQPWIPVLTCKGERYEYGLLETLECASEIQSLLSPVPVVTASLYRVLLAILERVFHPTDDLDWTELYRAGSFDSQKLKRYFSRTSSRFNLFDEERPFYQAPDPRVHKKNLLKMVPHLSSGNNATLFDHSTETRGITFSPAEAARYLIALQYYGLGGLSGIQEKFTAAPACRGISFFIQGKNLFETLMLNLIPPYRQELTHSIPAHDPSGDLPCWEMDDPYKPRTPKGLLDYLTWQNRRVLLFPEMKNGQVVVRTMTEAPGLRLADNFVDGVSIRDPYQFYYQGTTGPNVLRFTEDRATWRDSASLFQFELSEAQLLAPPNLLWMHVLMEHEILSRSDLYRVNALGMAANKSKVLFYGDQSLPLPAAFLADTDLVNDLRFAMDKADALGKILYRAVSVMAEMIIDPNTDRKDRKPDKKMVEAVREHLKAERVYWGELEIGFYRLVEDLPQDTDSALQAWKNLLRAKTHLAFDHSLALAGEDPRVFKAAAVASGIVYYGLKEHTQ